MRASGHATGAAGRAGEGWADAPVESLSPGDVAGQAFDALKERGALYGRISREEASMPTEALLRRLGLTSGGHPTRAAALLFRRDSAKISEGARIRIGRIRGGSVLFQNELAGEMYLAVDSAVDLVMSRYSVVPITYDRILRVENQPYPEEALREAIENAVVNADYSRGEPIRVRVFDDHLTVENAGGLPGLASLEAAMEDGASAPRNAGMASAFRMARHAGGFGRGFGMMLDSYREMGGSPPSFHASADRFSARLPNIAHEKGIIPRDMRGRPASQTCGACEPPALSRGEEAAHEFLRSAGESSEEDLAAGVGADPGAMPRIMRLLECRGLAKRGGSPGAWTWSATVFF